ncbi:unnamed protein product, partial [Adineta steineri]
DQARQGRSRHERSPRPGAPLDPVHRHGPDRLRRVRRPRRGRPAAPRRSAPAAAPPAWSTGASPRAGGAGRRRTEFRGGGCRACRCRGPCAPRCPACGRCPAPCARR